MAESVEIEVGGGGGGGVTGVLVMGVRGGALLEA